MSELDSRRSQIGCARRVLHLVRTIKRGQAAVMLRTDVDCVPREFAIPDAHDTKIVGRNDLLESFVEADDRLASRGERLTVVALDLVDRVCHQQLVSSMTFRVARSGLAIRRSA